VTSLFASAINAVKKAVHCGPVEFLTVVSLGGLGSLRPSDAVIHYGAVLATLVILDLWAGAMSAIYQKKFDGSKLFMRTVAKITGYSTTLLAVYAVIWAGAQVTTMSSSLKQEGVAGAMLIVISLLILHEARSVVLNAARMDLPVLNVIGRWLKRQETKAKAALDDE
jgi:phage-related holin